MKNGTREALQITGISVAFVGAILCAGVVVGIDDYRSHQVASEEAAGRYLSTTLNGSEGASGTGIGMSLTGKVVMGVVSTDSSLHSLVHTSLRTVMVAGAFTAPLGDALLLITMQDGTRLLCPSTKKDCRKMVDLED
ncbi:hypothetical protein [Paraburkholderia sp. J8-2]|uniref:hypothetical protein n=1 Tax=Paraburkholderia sp. J8-2 TaxID=2805440 RepID=UPI002AB6A6EC|nr:hypothetical protein [Paraburkholderia sp. J8-2]